MVLNLNFKEELDTMEQNNDRQVIKITQGAFYNKYLEYMQHLAQMMVVYIELKEKYDINSTIFYPYVERLVVLPTEYDRNNEKFDNMFMKRPIDSNGARQSKKTHQINKDWTKKLKELDIKDIQEPNIVEYLELKSANIEYDISQDVVYIILDENGEIPTEIKDKYDIISYETYQEEKELLNLLDLFNENEEIKESF